MKPKVKIFRRENGQAVWTVTRGNAPFGWCDGVGPTVLRVWEDYLDAMRDRDVRALDVIKHRRGPASGG
jgi:hypothetical protein